MKSEFERINFEISECKLCQLSETRCNTVSGEGVFPADIMLVGEAPGAEEDKQGRPFVGRSGRLLTMLLSEVGISREENLFITNTVKCRPPENRNPSVNESRACKCYLERQIKQCSPRVIITVGNCALKYFVEKNEGISKLHGTFLKNENYIIFPVYHPAALLRNPALIEVTRADLLKLAFYLRNKNIL